MLTPMTISDFTGGITDFPVGGRSDQCQYADNILLTKAGKPSSRYGSICFDVANAQLPTGNQKVASLWNFNEDTALFATSARRAFRYSAGWPELLGPTNNPFFSSGAANNRVSGGDWKGHLILTNDGGAKPMKVYQDQAGAFNAVTLGLPKYLPTDNYAATGAATAAIVALANDIRAKFLAHYADVALHTTAADGVSAALITAGVLVLGDSLATTCTLVAQLMRAYMNHYRDAVAKTTERAYHSNTLDDNPGQPNIQLSTSSAPTTWLEAAQMLNELKLKYNWHTRGIFTHPNAGTSVAVADLANTNGAPIVAQNVPASLLNLANQLKAAYNDHVTGGNHTTPSEASPGVGAFAFADMRPPQITAADATDLNTLIELGCHLIAHYVSHEADAEAKVYEFEAATNHPANLKRLNQLNAVDIIGLGIAPGQDGLLQFDQIWLFQRIIGMYIYKNLDQQGTSINYADNFPQGTKIVAPLPSNTNPTPDSFVDQNNDASYADGAFKHYQVAKKKYHSRKSNAENFAGMGAPIVDYNLLAGDMAFMFATLRSLATAYNLHTAAQKIHDPTGPYTLIDVTLYTNDFKSYEYAFCFKRKYVTLAGETFENRSTPYFMSAKVSRETPISSINLSNIAVLANGATDNYDTAGTTVEIYRTIDAGQTLYLVGEVPNGTTVFVDNVSDSDLIGNAQLYTNGGVLGNDPPPVAKFMHINQAGVTMFGWTTHTLDDGTTETVPNRVSFALEDEPDSAPGSNFVDLPASVAGVSSVRTVNIAFTKNSTHRLEGLMDSQGQGSIVAVTISDRVGLSGSFSPVQVDGGVVFAGPDQFYLTDGYSVQPLGKAWPATFANVVSGTRAYNMCGTFDKTNNRAWFGATGAGADNDRAFILDLNFQAKDGSGAWTTASNGAYFAPTALTVYNGQLIRGDTRGYVFKHDPAYTSDPRVDTATAAANWFTRWVPYQWRSVCYTLGGQALRQWSSIVSAKFANLGDLSAQLTGIQDEGRNTGNCAPLRVRGRAGTIDDKRYFPSGSMFSSLKQLELTLAKVPLYGSNMDGNNRGLATLNQAGKTLTIIAGAFPLDLVDHVVALENDGYTNEFQISNQTTGNTVLVLLDPLGALPANGGYKWIVRGKPKTEKMQAQEFTLWASQMGATQVSAATEGGSNS